MSFHKLFFKREGKEERDIRRGKGEEGSRRKREEKGVEDGGLTLSLYHSLYRLTISYLIPLSPDLSVVKSTLS